MTALNKQAPRMRNYLDTALKSGVKLLHLSTDELEGLLDELEAAEKRIAELEAVREVFLRAKALMYQSGGAPIENSLNPIDAWLYDAERAAAGIGVKGGREHEARRNSRST